MLRVLILRSPFAAPFETAAFGRLPRKRRKGVSKDRASPGTRS
jgi:hypothetical protein